MSGISPGHLDGAVASVESSRSPDSAENHTLSLGCSDCGRQPSVDYGRHRCMDHELTMASDNESTASGQVRPVRSHKVKPNSSNSIDHATTAASDNESTASWQVRPVRSLKVKKKCSKCIDHEVTNTSDNESATSSWQVRPVRSLKVKPKCSKCIDHEVTTASDDESTASWQMRAVRSLKVTNAELMRAMPVANALRCFASVLSDRPATSEYYSLSTPCPRIDTFVSHNWSTPRWKKFLVLAFHFNLHMSLAVSFLVAGCTCYLTARGLLPFTVGVVYEGEDGHGHMQGICALPAGLAAFFCSLVSLHELDRRRHSLFIDRCCVHQVDADLKREGIENLAAFLRNSRTFLVLYSEVYMKRLWTTYEVASWLMLHRGRNMIVRPLSAPVLLLYGCLCTTFLEALVFIVLFTDLPRLVQPVPGSVVVALCVFLGFTSGAWMVTKWTADRENMESTVASFSLRDAECKSEDDRRAVQQNILDFMKYSQLTDPEAGEAKVFNTFEDLVHREVPGLMRSSFGGVGVPYSWACVLGLPHSLVTFDYLAGYLLESQSIKYMELHAISHLVLTFVVGPLLLALGFALARLHGLRSVTGCILLGALGTLLLLLCGILFGIMVKQALHSKVWCAAMHATYAALALGTLAIYGRLPRWCQAAQ